ncbi:hypothetical protein N7467_004074 [Penicillium canescens]|nr:hypothetical protein N7467_004074 [Penicillium canescens]
MPSGIEHFEDVQPNIYRAPEIWDLFESQSLFTGYDAEFQTYRSLAYLSEMISLLGPPLLSDFCAEMPLRARVSLEQRESTLEGEEKLKFLNLIRKMLQWEPGMRSSAKKLAQDEWICQNL